VAVAIADANYQRNAEAAFIDDTWKFTPKLTLSLGLRYELTPPWTDILNNEFTVALPLIYDGTGGPRHNSRTSCARVIARALYRAARHQRVLDEYAGSMQQRNVSQSTDANQVQELGAARRHRLFAG